MKKLFFPFFLVVQYIVGFSQSISDSSIFMFHVKPSYSFQIPGGDLAKRYGVNSTIGIDFSMKTKSNWILGLGWHYLFGNQVKENVLDSLKNSNGEIINNFGDYSVYVLSERGYIANLHVGKIIPVLHSNPNSGLFVNASIGFLQHKILIENDGNNTPSINKDYTKGYDRLSNGLMAAEFVGYLYVSKHRLWNFYAGFEFTQAWTKNRRNVNFDTRQSETGLRKDYLYGIKIGWILPLYQRAPEKFYYY